MRTAAADDAMFENLDRTKDIGIRARELLVAGDLDTFAYEMHEHWMNKRHRSPGMSNARIDALYATACESGAIGGKLVGAGGGGFLLVYSSDPDHTRAAMSRVAADEVRFAFDLHGCVASHPG